MINSPVTEMVQNPLRVPYPDFLRIFSEKMEPILLSQPGFISVMTGLVLSPVVKDIHGPTAVSMALWESLEAHEAFLGSAAAAPFFEAVKPLLTGPPTIRHYQFDSLSSTNLKSRYSNIFQSITPHEIDFQPTYELQVKVHGREAVRMGPCIETPAQSALVLFGDKPQLGAFDDVRSDMEAMTVTWDRHSVKDVTPNL